MLLLGLLQAGRDITCCAQTVGSERHETHWHLMQAGALEGSGVRVQPGGQGL